MRREANNLGLDIYSGTSIARTRMARLPWLIRTHFESIRNHFDNSREQIFRKIYHEFYVACTH